MWNKRMDWIPISKNITEELKEIEKLAGHNIKEAYKLSFNKQIKYAFEEEESCFKIYSLILGALNSNAQNILQFNNKKDPTEQDFVVKIWGPIFSTIFDDSALFTKWGDSINEESSKAKREMDNEKFPSVTKSTVEFALKTPMIKLVDNGLNAANKLGSLRLPSTGLDMRKARTLIERLFTTKKDAKYLAKCHTILSNGVALALKSTNQKQNNKRSPYDKEQDDEIKSGHYCAWIRGSWFPPLQKKDKPYYGQYPPGLFKH
ncbi:hypothetical protein G6F46_004858 [Rhizopus delemar]|uniref:Uncharacterized protein n=2 Tax=Rhizopus TaxID=4842 RepID=A0A9P6ZAE6_9FUNG|nr:hypothetical protein G6F36_012297 [Rhizopus arrhizus]KAG1460831.1 hypothetical protein G6F55_003936 [Rhizopus delemar]KAG1499722.1 hypothetical protein G6F54_004220 [Rhizopus delemar]KAG1512725.1 hypothetical protein G6F53_004962 [Rhizopus delemar]KAG1524166.1 hypothetical protein G6F52_004417 [Rhizopus delemar]